MLSVSIVSICLLLVSFFVGQSISMQENIKSDRQIEWHLFLNQLEYDLKDSYLKNVYSHELVVEKKLKSNYLEEVSYERYITLLRRRVGGAGHQPMLRKIKKLHFEPVSKQIKIEVIFTNDEMYTAFLPMPKERIQMKSQEE